MHVLSLTLLASFLAPQDPRNATIQLPKGHQVTGAMLADINIDERVDLVKEDHRWRGETRAREEVAHCAFRVSHERGVDLRPR